MSKIQHAFTLPSCPLCRHEDAARQFVIIGTPPKKLFTWKFWVGGVFWVLLGLALLLWWTAKPPPLQTLSDDAATAASPRVMPEQITL